MILSIVALLVQVQVPAAAPTAPASDERPVHVWIDTPSPLFRGLPVRVYVQTATSGNLIVLHRRTDGRIEPLFPASPKAEAWVHAGEYEIRSPGDRPAFVLAEPDGGGMILAALTSGPIWFDEFAHDASWKPDALVASWGGADAEGALTDIVQRMLGDGSFNYDILSYVVRPVAYAQRPELSPASPQQDTIAAAVPQDMQLPPTCLDCTFIGTQIVEAPIFIVPGGFRRRRFEERREPPPPPQQAIARVIPSVGPVLGHPGVPDHVPGGRTFTTPRRNGTGSGAEPRPREAPTTSTAALPLVPGRPVRGVGGERPPVATPASRSALALRYVRAHPMASATSDAGAIEVSAASASTPMSSAPGTIVTPASLRRPGTAMTFRMPQVPQTATETFSRPTGTGTAPQQVQPRAQAGTFAIPMSVWQGGGTARAGVIRSGGRQH